MGSHKVVGKGYFNTENNQTASIDAIFSPLHIMQNNYVNPWPSSSANHVMNCSQLYTCLGEMELHLQVHPSTRGHLISPRNKPQQMQPGNVQHQYSYLPELLVNVLYGYCVMVKSESCCCVCGSWLFSNPVTNTLILTELIDKYFTSFCIPFKWWLWILFFNFCFPMQVGDEKLFLL